MAFIKLMSLIYGRYLINLVFVQSLHACLVVIEAYPRHGDSAVSFSSSSSTSASVIHTRSSNNPRSVDQRPDLKGDLKG